MTSCPCGEKNEFPVFIGLQRDFRDQVALALYNCSGCHTTKAIRWEKTTERQRRDAINAELARLSMGGLI